MLFVCSFYCLVYSVVAALPEQTLFDLHQAIVVLNKEPKISGTNLSEGSRAVLTKAAVARALSVSKRHMAHGVTKKLMECFGGDKFIVENAISPDGILIDFAVQVDCHRTAVKWATGNETPAAQVQLPTCHRLSDVSCGSLDGVPALPAGEKVAQRLAILVIDQQDCIYRQGDPTGSSLLSAASLTTKGWKVVLVSCANSCPLS